MVTLTMMQTMWPQNNDTPRRPDAQLLQGIAVDAPTIFARHGLNNDRLVAHAMSQFSHECGNGRTMTENINYSPARAAAVWPTRFSSAADCEAKVGCSGADPAFPTRLMDLVYGKRNGNRPGTSDGSKYIGRGLAQVTGRANYETLGNQLGLDLVGQPELVTHPQHALECGVAMFVLRGCVAPAQDDDVRAVTKCINGGQIGLQDRKLKLEQWKNALLQQALNRLGANPVLLTDGAFGKKSIDALMAFQHSHGLPSNGRQNDSATLAAIESDIAALP
ncbi:peptidoglycan-binding protein [Variovorax sp. J22R133]|uniref:peptidoglycan-binding protein n=1 Tax=Variovorax brevis TaxID=3053503 RepID=UPI002577E0BD|nr:peptidoglycan-binding protein [Variovorax sp. J22R133]MDM0115405.1 peptidoglycan-binding protein [Variovorax sp. J22R133]